MVVSVEFLWLFSSKCNYGCPYCSYVLSDTRKGLVKMERIRSVAQWGEAWDRIHDKYGSARIYMTSSGEPTMYPDFVELAERLVRRHDFTFDTNFSWPMEKAERFTREVPPQRVKVHTTFHPLDADFDAFASKVALLRDRGFSYQCRLVGYPPFLKDLPALRARFRERGLVFAVTPYSGPYEGREYPGAYTEEERALILEIDAEGNRANPDVCTKVLTHLAHLEAERPTGRACRSGFEYGCLMPDGSVYRCQEYGTRGWGPIGDFFDPDFSFGPAPAVCESPRCSCEYRWLVPESAPAAARR